MMECVKQRDIVLKALSYIDNIKNSKIAQAEDI